MGMSTHVIGFVLPDDPTYKKHADVLLACEKADVSLPKETAEYFGCSSPEPCLLEEKLQTPIPIYEWSDEYRAGYELFVSEIPKGVHKIRFYNSW